MFKNKLANKLFLLISLITLLSMTFSIVIYTYFFKQYVKNIIKINSEYTINLIDESIKNLQDTTFSIAVSISKDKEIKRALYKFDKIEISRITEKKYNPSNFKIGYGKGNPVKINIISPEGVIIHCTPRCKNEVGNPIFLSKLFMKAYENEEGQHASKGIETCGQDKICISSYKKILSDSKDYLGFVQVSFRINDNFLQKISHTTNADVFVFRKEMVIAASKMNFITEKLTNKIKKITEKNKGKNSTDKFHFISINSKNYSIALKNIYDSRKNIISTLLIAIDVSSISSLMLKGLIFIISTTAMVMIISFFGSFYLSRLIIKPITSLLNTIKNISAGDLSSRAQVITNDEIGELAIAFNTMTNDLQQRDEALKKSLEELKENQKYLIQSGRLAAVGEFSAGLAHEIGNPLSVISGYVQMLKQNSITNDTKIKIYKTIENEISHIEKIIGDLLNFSRPSNGKIEAVNINNIIEDTINLLAVHSSFQKVVVKRELDDIPLFKCNAKEIQQVFFNICLNAAQAMKEGGVLKIITKLDSINKNSIIIYFIDTGSGIPTQHIDKIFNPFFSTKQSEGGTGLGLSISYRIIQKYGGKIEVDSQVNIGTTFKIILPLDTLNHV